MPQLKNNTIEKAIVLLLMLVCTGFAQTITVQFYAVEAESFRTIEQIQVHLPDTTLTSHAIKSGRHSIDVPLGTYNLEHKAENRQMVSLPLFVLETAEVKDLGHISFYLQTDDDMGFGSVQLSSQELDSGDTNNHEAPTIVA